MSRASLRRNGPRSGLSRADSSKFISDFAVSGVVGVFFLPPELRSGDGLIREVEGEGEGVRRGIGEYFLGVGFVVSDCSGVARFGASVDPPTTDSRGGGVLFDTIPGMVAFAGKSMMEREGKVVGKKLENNDRSLRTETVGVRRGDWIGSSN